MKRYIIAILFISLWCCGGVSLNAQTIPVDPVSDQYVDLQNPATATLYTMPSYDNNSLFDSYNELDDTVPHPMYFAFGMHQNIDLKDEGMNWVTKDTMKVLRLGFYSDSSLGFKFRFANLFFPANSYMFVYPPNREKIYGAYSAMNNRTSQTFITQEINYNFLIVELNVPISKFSTFTGIIDEVAYIYQAANRNGIKFNSAGQGQSKDTCQVNVVCYPYNGEWCNEIRSVVKLEIAKRFDPSNHDADPNVSHYARCSGALINNSTQDFTGYLITAHHCIDDYPSGAKQSVDLTHFLPNSVATFNFASSECRPTGVGNDQMTLVGMQLVDKWGERHKEVVCPWNVYCPDQALLKLTDTMRIDYNTYYAGWNKSTTKDDYEDQYVTFIHHPKGDVKKFSKGIFMSDKLTNGCFNTDCFKVGVFVGGVEPASSGAPLFGSDHKIVGAVSRGAAQYSGRDPLCDMVGTSGGTEIGFGKFGEAYAQFQPFLSPDNNDRHYLEGADPIGVCQNTINVFGRLYPGTDWQAKNQIIIQASNQLNLAPNNIPTLLKGSGVPGNTGLTDYVFQAGNSVRINKNFSIKVGNAMQIKIASCLAYIDCGFNSPAPPQQNTGVDKVKDITTGIKVYPNPTKDYLNIESESDFKYSVMDITGKVIFTGEKNADSIVKVNFSQYINGLYIISVKTDKSLESFKIIKQ